ncbi:NUDIX hydrolase domain-like protein [Xylariaceae sp. FL1019]|nr:NUDIX hydrolase domain-like protein [Xylariaceae sp. FL1019]
MDYLVMPHNAFLAGFPQYDKVVVGAAILQKHSPDTRILLLKRDADEKHYPGVFGIPGGKVDATDATIRDAIVREVADECALIVTKITHALSNFCYTTKSRVVLPPNDKGEEKMETVTKRCVHLGYVVEVEEGNVKTNAEEHSEGIWANREEVGSLDMSIAMRDLVLEALA